MANHLGEEPQLATNLNLVFSAPAAPDEEYDTWYREHLNAVVTVPGWEAARRYRANEIVGKAPELTDFSHLAVYEVGADPQTNRAALLETLDRLRATGEIVDPAWFADIRAVSYEAIAVDGTLDALPEHLYLVLTGTPEHLGFEGYSEWYHTHLRENLEGEGFARGWRFRLEPSVTNRLEMAYTHLALYEVSGDIHARLDQLHELRDRLGYVTDEWFWELPIAGIDAHALDAPVGAART